MEYYHDTKMQKLFQVLEEPKSLDEIDLSRAVIQNLLLKIINTYGNITVQQMHEISGLHIDLLEECLRPMEKDDLIVQTSGGFLFASVEYTIKKKGHQKAVKLIEENPYIGLAPVTYDEYFKIMEVQIKGRYPLTIPEEVIQRAFHDVVGMEYPKKVLTEAAIGGKGFFIYGPPGTGKTFLTSKMSELLPPIIMPRYVEFSGNIIQMFDPDFHRMRPEQPGDARWVKIFAPFVFTGSELSTEKMETLYNPNKGVYETSPLIKANGGVLLLDDLGRQKEDPNVLLNRMIVPLENKKDVIYIKGAPVIVHTHFIPALSTNLEITIVDEAHLRRAPLHVYLEVPSSDEIVEVFKRNLDMLKEDYDNDVLERFRRVYIPQLEGGESLKPTFAHARDIAQIAQAIRIRRGEDKMTVEILEEALDQHILVSMQRRYTPELFDRIISQGSKPHQ
ncbi:ATP-binding protein [Methanobacterium ferruginis]|uniref:ATP-binding protein n=1 Tax=Methanobacterium ferruginis TaxID=710191 RepID=UPI002572F83A|nr:ATP-binding protein [Methanobacterium ferruginis]BDZ69031.1 ATPase AAA [Methanobacterium ferruginis]